MLGLAGLQIWSVETGVALPEIGRLGRIVAPGQRPRILPDTIETRMVLQVWPTPGRCWRTGIPISAGNSGQIENLQYQQDRAADLLKQVGEIDKTIGILHQQYALQQQAIPVYECEIR